MQRLLELASHDALKYAEHENAMDENRFNYSNTKITASTLVNG